MIRNHLSYTSENYAKNRKTCEKTEKLNELKNSQNIHKRKEKHPSYTSVDTYLIYS